MADKRISQLIERTDIANNDVLPIVASGATTTNKVTISTIQTWMQDNLDVGVTSVGLSMPSAFVVSNSPVTASGNITVTGAGTVAQYIRGDGSLADFPQSAGGGGASVSYYLNGSVSQGTIGGIAYLEMNKTPILGAGTDFTIAADGYIASFITDAGDPGLLEIPGGNWNFETYLSASSGGGSPTFYIELYKVNSGGTATLIASNSATPESISLGTNINPYFSALAVPTTTLALTDRLALRYYVTHAGRTITLHTENSHLCQIITTFTTGLTALNGLTAQVQNFATGTSGTDFNISSAGSTHTFNIPSASAIARGLVTTGTQTIAGSKTFSDTLYTTPDAIINGLNVGKGGGNLTTNTRFGTAALGANTTGSSNTAIGFGSSQSNTTGTSNTAVGLYSLLYNTIGASNTAIGSGSMLSNTIGNQNTAIGDSSLYSNTSGSQNTAIGRGSLNTNSTGNDNSGIGFFALYSNTTGSANTSVGSRSLYTNTTGTGNTATGYFSLRFNTTGGSNTATGYVALSANTTGNANTATGAYALENNTTGSDNTAVGQEALENNTTGGNNTAIGFQALRSNTGNGANTAVGNLSLWNNTAGLNTALGHISLYSNTTGEYNVGLGIASLYNNTTGSYNIAIGDQSGQFISGGGNNIISNNSLFIGTQTRALGNNQTNQIVIGHNAVGNGSNTVTIGNSSITENYFTGNIRGGALISTSDSSINGVSIGKGASSVATNTSLGFQTLAFNTTGSSNTSIGWNSLYLNTTGSSNTSIGVSSGASNTTGGFNSFYGVSSGFANTTGSNNSFFGNVSGQENTTGAQNSFFGASSGRYIANGSPLTIANNSVMLGFDTRAAADNQTNQIVIGHQAIGNGSNTVTLGNDSITTTFLKGNISLKGENSAVKSIQYTNPSGTLHWSVQTSFGSAGEHQPFSIRNGVLGTDAILIQPASNNITLNNSITNLLGSLSGTSASFTGAVSSSSKYTWGSSTTGTTGQIATDGTNNYLDYIGNLVFRGAAASNTLATISSTGAVTLTGALNGTSAIFSEQVRINHPGQSLLIFPTTTNSARMQIQSSGGGNLVVGTESSAGGDLASGTSAYSSVFTSGSTRDLFLGTNSVQRLKIDGSTGAATFSSSVTAGTNIESNNGHLLLSAGSGTSYSSKLSTAYNYPYVDTYLDSLAGASYDGRINFRIQRNGGAVNSIMTLMPEGNVGIGTPSPQATLDVAGNIRVGNQLDSTSRYVGKIGTGGTIRNAVGFISSSTEDYVMINTHLSGQTSGECARFTGLGFLKASNNGVYINATGNYHEINSNQADAGTLLVQNFSASPYGHEIYYRNASPNNTGQSFLYCQDSTPAQRAAIRSNGGLANYQANDVNLSDERTKKDIEPLESYWDKFKAIEIVKFKYKDQTHDDFNIGVIAQQVEAVAPEFVDVDGWDVKPKLDEEGNEIVSEEEPLKSIYTADLYHASIKVLQEAMAKIEKLEAEIESLKSQING